jgi:adenine-specific DNA-methyltransferase
MARRPRKSSKPVKKDNVAVDDYRHESAKRKNNPPAKIAAEGSVPLLPKIEYSYSPRLSPVLRFDSTGKADKLPDLLEAARQRALTSEELQILSEALRKDEPWLEWAGKRESKGFKVDPVALHIHERISTQAILKVAARQDVQRNLFADPQQAYHEAVKFYQYDIDWTNRLILGDSLQVMASLARREDLAGKVQMIYMDPPYGIKFSSNFQPQIGKRDVSKKEQDLTRELEMVKAYRDTWHLGTHSYLTYLRDRLIVSRELLSDSGSIFVQISDENLHHVREIMDSVFGPDNFCGLITFYKTTSQTSNLAASTTDYLLWYGRNRIEVKYRQVYLNKSIDTDQAGVYSWIQFPNGERRRMTASERIESKQLKQDCQIFRLDNMTSQSGGETTNFSIGVHGKNCVSGKGFWKTNLAGMRRLIGAERVVPSGITLAYIRNIDDFPVYPVANLWTDTGTGSFTDAKVYVVQTGAKVVERCMLMTTDPGDLVIDPTCGSGTTAYIAEQWGRRWITIDTSRVAVAIARQRLLTAKFDYFELKSPDQGPNKENFVYRMVPHVTLKSIAQNTALDPIFQKHDSILLEKLVACNQALTKLEKKIRSKLLAKLTEKQKRDGKKSITEADRRRWKLPETKWEEWELPVDTDPDYPQDLAEAVTAYRKAWRAKMDEVNACVEANAEQEELVDQPEIVKEIVRVSGPFTVEAVQPPELSLGDVVWSSNEGKFDGDPDKLENTFDPADDKPVYITRFVESRSDLETRNLDAYLEKMSHLLAMDGVRFPDNRQMRFSRLKPLNGGDSGLHAEGRWVTEGDVDPDPEGIATVCVGFGPQYGPVTAKQVEDLVRAASRRGYEDLVIAGFSFDGPAQATIEEAQHPKLRIHMANIRPDVNPGMNGLLKEQPGSQLFTVFGQPRTRVEGPDSDGNYVVFMEGVDIYNPVDNSINPTGADKVAAWFIDGDYDGWTFCITQAFFPDRTAWEKLSKALKGVIDSEAFDILSSTISMPFPAGKHKCVAVKIIDPRGNEVMRIHKL